MATCDTCGNDYDKAFRVETSAGTSLTFDCIECAAHQLAPPCAHCGCRVLGHGVEANGRIFCCARCADAVGEHALVDRV